MSNSSTKQNPTPRTRTGCQSCRVRHLKCDEGRPSCSRCAKAGIECVRGYNIRFRHGANPSVNIQGGPKCDYDFSEDQTWLQISNAQISFVDETNELAEEYDGEQSEPSPSHYGYDDAQSPLQASFHGSPASAPEFPTENRADVSLNRRLPSLRSESFGNMDMNGSHSPEKRRKLFHSPTSFPSAFQASPENQHATSYHSPMSATSHAVDFEAAHRQSIGSAMESVYNFGSPPQRLPSISQAIGNLGGLDQNGLGDIEAGFSAVSETMSKIYLEKPVWPLPGPEAYLMRYFVDNLSRAFDLCDDGRQFAQVVPQRAAICPTLLNAVLAASARHLSRLGDYDGLASDTYHQACLTHLIPMLSDNAAIMDENLLAATVILRFLEEIEVPLSGTDSQSHLLGTHVFISAQEHSTQVGGLRQAAFWVALRQDIYVAFVNQRTIAPAFEHCEVDRSFDPAPDCTWANRIVVHCADVIRFCFGEGERSTPRYNELCSYSQQWMLFKPSSFSPIYYKELPTEEEGDGDNDASPAVFPEIWLLGDHVACALQHHHLALILLAAHNPKVPRLGPGQKVALQAMEREIKTSVLELCGIAVSNPKCSPNWVTACLGVAMCGDRFTARREQEALVGLLKITEEQHGWPTGTVIRTLTEMWGWDDQ